MRMLTTSLLITVVVLLVLVCSCTTQTDSLNLDPGHPSGHRPRDDGVFTKSRRTFYGLNFAQLLKLHRKHVKHLNDLYQTSYGGIDEYNLMQTELTFPWTPTVNRTCPEIDWTFKYEEPFLHMSLPVCGDVIKPKMILLHGSVECELDPFYLPNNKTSNCSQALLRSTQVKQIVIIIHGFLKSISSSWMHDMSSALMEDDNSTAVLLVGWGHGSGGSPIPDPFYYYQAAANTRYMGVAVAKMLINLVEHSSMLTNRAQHSFSFHCIGHSLGAHICGFLGKNIKSLTHYSLRRISGLDPAGPLFAIDVPYPFNFIHISKDARLNKEDAGFVDVIHTDGRARFSFEVIPQYGTMLELGHVDFYPGSNGEFGWNQPGCWQVEDIGSCSHSRSHDLYLSSMNTSCHALQSCDNTTLIPNDCSNITFADSPTMGFWVDREKFSGEAFTVLTDAKPPFCINATKFIPKNEADHRNPDDIGEAEETDDTEDTDESEDSDDTKDIDDAEDTDRNQSSAHNTKVEEVPFYKFFEKTSFNFF